MSGANKRILTIFGNCLFLLNKAEIVELLRSGEAESNRFTVFAEYFRSSAEELLLNNRDMLNQSDASIAFGIVLWRIRHEGLQWNNAWERVFRYCTFNGYTENLINVARLGVGIEDKVPKLKPLLLEWRQVEELLSTCALTYDGIGDYDLNSIIEFLNVFGAYLKASSLFIPIGSQLEALLEDVSRFKAAIELSIGPLLLLFYDLRWNASGDLDLLLRLQRSYDAVTGREYSGCIAGYRLFGEGAGPLISESGLDKDAISLLKHLSE